MFFYKFSVKLLGKENIKYWCKIAVKNKRQNCKEIRNVTVIPVIKLF